MDCISFKEQMDKGTIGSELYRLMNLLKTVFHLKVKFFDELLVIVTIMFIHLWSYFTYK
jgi:hypothetical protein